jgi:hypothetical protein
MEAVLLAEHLVVAHHHNLELDSVLCQVPAHIDYLREQLKVEGCKGKHRVVSKEWLGLEVPQKVEEVEVGHTHWLQMRDGYVLVLESDLWVEET